MAFLRRTALRRAAVGGLALLLFISPVAVPALGAGGDDLPGNPLLTRRTERALERGLKALQDRQRDDGGWDKGNRVGVSALVMIAYMMHAHFPGEGPYGDTMQRGLDFLLKASESGMHGYMGTNMYSHGLATLALSELWGQTDSDEKVRKALKAGVDIILQSQGSTGGWRYNPEPSGGDVSVTAMQLVALASARQAGILVPDETIDKAIRYVKWCHVPSEGGFSYFPQSGPGSSGWQRTGAAVTSLWLAGEHECKEVEAGVEYLHEQLEVSLSGAHIEYGHYYAAITMHLVGEEEFGKWYPAVRDMLLERQREDGTWGGDYSTAMYMIVLGLPRFFVPAYQR